MYREVKELFPKLRLKKEIPVGVLNKWEEVIDFVYNELGKTRIGAILIPSAMHYNLYTVFNSAMNNSKRHVKNKSTSLKKAEEREQELKTLLEEVNELASSTTYEILQRVYQKEETDNKSVLIYKRIKQLKDIVAVKLTRVLEGIWCSFVK